MNIPAHTDRLRRLFAAIADAQELLDRSIATANSASRSLIEASAAIERVRSLGGVIPVPQSPGAPKTAKPASMRIAADDHTRESTR